MPFVGRVFAVVPVEVVVDPVVVVAAAVVVAAVGVDALDDELPEEPPHAASPTQASEISTAVSVCMRH
jgi:hypothetical protein